MRLSIVESSARTGYRSNDTTNLIFSSTDYTMWRAKQTRYKLEPAEAVNQQASPCEQAPGTTPSTLRPPVQVWLERQGPQKVNPSRPWERKICSFLAVSHQMISERARNSLQGKWNRLTLKQLHFKNTTHRKDDAQGQALSFTKLIHYEKLFYLTPMSMQRQEKKTPSGYVTVKSELLCLKNCD